jgi:ribosome-associated translation inhibitor RaiA
MNHPVEIVLRDTPRSDALERYIGEEARKLGHICDRIRRCQVLIETTQCETEPGAQFAVRLIISLPGTEVVFNREHPGDVRLALREAFAGAGMQLKNHMRRFTSAAASNAVHVPHV